MVIFENPLTGERRWTPWIGLNEPRAAREIQGWTGGFVPVESFAKIEVQLRRQLGADVPKEWEDVAGPSAEDYVLAALFIAPLAGMAGKTLGLGAKAFSATYRVTIPLTAKSFAAAKAYMRAFLRGNMDDAIRYFGGRMGKLFGDDVGRFSSRLIERIFAQLPRLGPITSRYFATRLVLLERAITFAARSVPTQASWAISHLTRVMTVRTLELLRIRMDEVFEVLKWTFMPEFLEYRELAEYYWEAYEPERTLLLETFEQLRGEFEGFKPSEDLPELEVPTAMGKFDLKRARAAAIAKGWKPFTKMSGAQKSAFKRAGRGGRARRAPRERPSRAPATLYPESSPFGLLEQAGMI